MSTESTLTRAISSRVKPDQIAQLQHYAAIDHVTPSKFIARLIYAELQRRNSASCSAGADYE
jgi:hypothetical protein